MARMREKKEGVGILAVYLLYTRIDVRCCCYQFSWSANENLFGAPHGHCAKKL